MSNSRPLLVAIALLAGLLVTAPVAAMTGVGAGGSPAASADQVPAQTESSGDANGTVAPGERIGGVVDVGESEVEGEVRARALEHAFARADSNASRAAIVAATAGEVDERLAELEQRKQALQRARANGSISDGRYRAEIAAVAAQIEAVRDLANRTERAANGLPADVLRANGVNVTAIETLRTRAADLSGPEVAAIAQDIAGEKPGKGFGPPESPGQGPPWADGDRPGDGADRPGDGGAGDGGAGDGGTGDGGDGGPPEDRPGDGADGDDGQDGDDELTAGTPEPPTDPVTMTETATTDA